MTDAKKDEKETKQHRTTTLAELGANLPIIRRLTDGKAIEKRNFSFLEWDMSIEEQLAEKKAKSKSMGEFVNGMMSLLLADFCGQDFQAMSKEEKLITLNQLEYPNILYMYIYLRVEELGDEMRMDVGCPHCGKTNKDFVCSLNDMDVRVKDDKHERTSAFDLKKPIEVNGKVITGLKIDVAKWDAMEKADTEISENEAKIRQLLFKSSICGAFEGENKPMQGFTDVENIVKKLKKIDIERLSKAIAENNGGPLMAVKGNCSHCNKEWFKHLNWGYDYFFDSSSL